MMDHFDESYHASVVVTESNVPNRSRCMALLLLNFDLCRWPTYPSGSMLPLWTCRGTTNDANNQHCICICSGDHNLTPTSLRADPWSIKKSSSGPCLSYKKQLIAPIKLFASKTMTKIMMIAYTFLASIFFFWKGRWYSYSPRPKCKHPWLSNKSKGNKVKTPYKAEYVEWWSKVDLLQNVSKNVRIISCHLPQ